MDNHLNLVELKGKNLYSRILKMLYSTQCFFVPIVGTKAPVEFNNTQTNETNHQKVDNVKNFEGEEECPSNTKKLIPTMWKLLSMLLLL